MAPPEPVRGLPGGLVVFTDVLCPWATVVVLRLRAARRELGVDVPLVHLAHPLELLLGRPASRRVVDAEIPMCAAVAPDFGWSVWQGRLDEYPFSSLLAVEAVQAARRQSERAAEELDLELRRAVFVESRCISAWHEVLTAAGRCESVDVEQLTADLEAGAARAAVFRQSAAARAGAAECSGTVVAPDGNALCAPGLRTGWLGGRVPRGTPVVLGDEPDAYRDLVLQATESMTVRA